MSVEAFLQDLGLSPVRAGSQLRVDCPNCDDTKGHLYIAPGNGVGFCHKCSWSPNPYKLAEEITSKTPAEIMKLLEEFGLNDSDRIGSFGERPEATERKPLALSKDDIRQLTDEEKKRFCLLKQIEAAAFERFSPYVHRTEPWVLLPAFVPGDNSRACGWMRCGIDGQEIRLADGRMEKYPAIAGSRHGLFGLPRLMKEGPDTIIFCEAWRDALAAMSVGLHATASSGGASTWSEDWLDVFEGKAVYVCMDADVAGQKAAGRAADAIAKVAKEVYVVQLPYEVTESHGKDLHDYIVGDGNGRKFLLLLDKAKRYEPKRRAAATGVCDGQILLDDDHADTIAEAFVADSSVVYRYNSIDGWSIYKDRRYRRVEDDNEVGVAVRRFLKRCRYIRRAGDNEVLTKVKPTNARVRDIMGALAALEGVHITPEQHAPASLTGELDAANVIAVGNCLLDISGEEPRQMALTEDFYTFNYMPFDYDPQAECPGWMKFLGEVFTVKDDSAVWDEEKVDFVGVYKKAPDGEAAGILQEWFGYFITSGTYLQKIFSIVGPRRSGKSTIGKVLRALVGAANTAAPTLTSLSSEFGLQPLLNKTLAIIGDAHLGGKTGDVTVAVERLKSISGEDSQQINRKNRTHVQVDRLGVRFLIIANEMQDMRDSSGALASRFNFLITTESFLGNEDTGLEERLLGELAGIFNWALDGLKRLRERGYIEEHPASCESREDFELMSSPMTAFVNEWCVVGPGNSVPVDALWRAHGEWSKVNGRGDGYSKQKFASRIRGVVPGIKKDRRRMDLSTLRLDYGVDSGGDDNRVNVYIGIDLKDGYRNRVDSGDTADRGWTP
jgi:putative DNA primase/helicase